MGARVGIEEGHRSPYRILPRTWEEMEDSLSPSFRKSLRRKVAKAHRKGLTTRITSDASSLDEVFQISVDTWQHEGGTGIGSSGPVRSFFEGVARRLEKRGVLQVAILEAETRPIAFELNLVESGVVYSLKMGHRKDARSLSPGIVLRRDVLEEAVNRGFTEFDFFGEEEEYKMHWASGVRPHGTIYWFGRGLRSFLVHFSRYRLRPLIKARAPKAVEFLRRLRDRRPWGTVRPIERDPEF